MQPASNPRQKGDGAPDTVRADGLPPDLLEALIAVTKAEAGGKPSRPSRTVEFALAIGGGFRLSRARLEQLYYAALFLEAATIRASAASRTNGGPKQGHREALLRQLEDGGRICVGAPFLVECRKILRSFSERYGAGVSRGQSPLEARILLTAEGLASLETRGPNREPLSAKTVLERLVLDRGGRVDPEVLAFLRSDDGERLLEGFLRAVGPSPIASMREMTQQAAARLRRHLLQARSAQPQAPEERRPSWFGRNRLKLAGALVAVSVALGLGAGVVSASQDAVPGEDLYLVKRAFEDVQLLLAAGGREPALHLRFANERLEEIETLVEEERHVPDSLLADLGHEAEVLAAHLEGEEVARGFELAERLREHGERAHSVLEGLHGINDESETVLAAALSEVKRAQFVAAGVVGRHEAAQGGKDEDEKDKPAKDGAPGRDTDDKEKPDRPKDPGPPEDRGPPEGAGPSGGQRRQ